MSADTPPPPKKPEPADGFNAGRATAPVGLEDTSESAWQRFQDMLNTGEPALEPPPAALPSATPPPAPQAPTEAAPANPPAPAGRPAIIKSFEPRRPAQAPATPTAPAKAANTAPPKPGTSAAPVNTAAKATLDAAPVSAAPVKPVAPAAPVKAPAAQVPRSAPPQDAAPSAAARPTAKPAAAQGFEPTQPMEAAPPQAFAPTQPMAALPARAPEPTPPKALPAAPSAAAAPAAANKPATLDDAMALVRRNNRSCPVPDQWTAFHKLLPPRVSDGRSFSAPPPLDGSIGATMSAMQKRLRLRDQIEWAERTGALQPAFDFLAALREDEWQHFD